MIWRLTYCNKDGVEARLDIIRGALTPVEVIEGTETPVEVIEGTETPVEVIEGTETPFILNYKMDKPDKSGFFMTSSADISIFETASFNIDNLKTSSETEIKVEYYINNILDWAGFVIPDFFSKTIGTPSTVEMVASDRLGTLKSVTLDDLNQYVSMRDLAIACLAKTGLTLPLYTMADFVNNSQSNAFFKALGLAGRLSDTKGRNISCYDILKSILVASNSKLVQQSGAWYIVNKFQHEQGAGSLFSTLTASTSYSEQTVSFSNVHAGARRTIVPVGATTGVFHEFGGGRIYPDNFDFADGLSGWTLNDGFNVTTGNKEVKNYVAVYDAAWARYYDEPHFEDYTVKPYLVIRDIDGVGVAYLPYMQKAGVPIVSNDRRTAKIKAEIVSTGLQNTRYRVEVILNTGTKTLYLDSNGAFTEEVKGLTVDLSHEDWQPSVPSTRVVTFEGVINALEEEDNVNNYTLTLKVFGAGRYDSSSGQVSYFNTYLLHSFAVTYESVNESGKGLIYRRNQGIGFTKEHDIDTTIFGDYMRKGLDGHFYEYRIDDTSSLYRTAGTLTQPLWTAHNDTEQLPLLRHVTRQKSRMFSLAHNMISARIDVSTFKPLNIFVGCNSVRHVVVSATYDFLRSEVEVELEQIAYTTLDVREFIYSYFGEGEQGISSVGGVSGGGGGGGSTAPSYWQLDENGNLYTVYNAYSQKELSAYGFGGSGGGGGGLIETVYGYANLGGTFSNTDLNNTFNAYTVNQLHLRIATLEAGGGSGGSVEWADILNKPSWIGATKPSYSWSEISDKPSTFAPSAHTHTKSQITDFAHTHPFTEITGVATTTQIPNLAISKITGLQTALNGKFNNPTGTTAQYLRGDGSLATFPTGAQGTVTSVGLSAPTGFTVSGSPVTSSGTLALTFASGYSLPTTAKQTAWDNHLTNQSNPHSVTAGQVGAYALGSNVASATKLQTPRTIWGQSFDGTANVSGALTGVTNITASVSVTTPKVIFSAAGWAMVQVGTELQMQYNGVAKMKYTSTGKILSVDDIVAYS